MVRLPALTAFGPTKLALSRKRSTPRSSSISARDSGIPPIISFSRSISAAQSTLGLLTLIWWTWAWLISCRAWPAATSTFFRRAAAIWAGAAEVAFLDHRHRHPGLPSRHCDAEAGIAAAQDQHIVAIGCHELAYPGAAALPNAQEALLP